MDKEVWRERYSRHCLLDGIGEAGQQKLAQARVLLVGVGGLGSPIALYLAAAGIGKLGLVDDDVVSLSNLQRQVLYTEDEVGEKKVFCAARRLQALNANLEVATYPVRLTAENAEALLEDYDLIVDGSDNFATRYIMQDASKKQHKPYVYGAIREFGGQVSVFNLKKGISYRSLFPEEETQSIPHPPLGVLGVLPGIVGCTEAAEVIKIITGCGEPLSGKLWTIDLLTMQTCILNL